jgi:hypothetical protein
MWGSPFRDTWINIFDSPRSHVYIRDCIVDFETGLIYKDGEILWEAANEAIIWAGGWISTDPRWKNRITRQDVIRDRMIELNENFKNKINSNGVDSCQSDRTVLHLLHPFNRFVFGHLFDTLQKLYIAENLKLEFHSVLLPKTNEIIDFDLHLNALGLQDKNQINSNGRLISVKNLLFIMPVGHPTSFTPESYFYIRNKYQSFFGVDKNPESNKKIFLTRRPGVFKRVLLNDEEIESALREEGISYFDGSESFEQIIKGFAHASHVAGVHGSLFTNNIYGNERAKYLEYCPRTRENHTFHHQYKVCDSYRHVLVDADASHNVSLDIKHLLEFYGS